MYENTHLYENTMSLNSENKKRRATGTMLPILDLDYTTKQYCSGTKTDKEINGTEERAQK